MIFSSERRTMLMWASVRDLMASALTSSAKGTSFALRRLPAGVRKT